MSCRPSRLTSKLFWRREFDACNLPCLHPLHPKHIDRFADQDAPGLNEVLTDLALLASYPGNLNPHVVEGGEHLDRSVNGLLPRAETVGVYGGAPYWGKGCFSMASRSSMLSLLAAI